jgi:glycosyltransferase involved in cell wall biosynthesis
MKILVVTSNIPSLGKKGDQVLSFYRLSYLSKYNSIQVICYGDVCNDTDRKSKLILENMGITVYLVKKRYWILFGYIIKAVFNQKTPYQCASNMSFFFGRAFEKLLGEFKPDVVYCVVARMFDHVKNFNGPIYVDLIDSLGLNFTRRKLASKGFYKWLYDSEAARMIQYERHVVDVAKESFVVSEIDKNFIKKENINVLPLGIDFSIFNLPAIKTINPIVVFTGNMFYQPNAEAVLWFYNNCWRQILDVIPNAEFLIAGADPLPIILGIGEADTSVKVLGRVDSIASILKISKISVAPMQSGSGMQFKILEAMACGLPVVTTKLGLGDIRADPNNDILVSDSPLDFTKNVIELLSSDSLSSRVGNNGFNYVHSNHNWEIINQNFANKCNLHSS